MRILFLAHLRDVTGCTEMTVPGAEMDTDGLWRHLIQAHPRLELVRHTVRLARNSEYVSADTQFRDTDEVALIPPVSGG